MRRTPAAALILVLGLSVLGGCSGGDEGDPDAQRSAGGTNETPPGIDTRVEVGAVAGKLAKGPARDAAADVAEVVDGWLDAAYVAGDYPRSDFGDAFPGFTKGAAALATKQPSLMSNKAVGADVEEVTATRRVVRVDLLAPKGEVAAATAHVDLVIELDGAQAFTDAIRGRVLLTRSKGGWQVFGFDIERGEVRG